jgi:hypothetical protein
MTDSDGWGVHLENGCEMQIFYEPAHDWYRLTFINDKGKETIVLLSQQAIDVLPELIIHARKDKI